MTGKGAGDAAIVVVGTLHAAAGCTGVTLGRMLGQLRNASAMSTDGLPKPPLADQPDWPGRAQGVPPPPSREGVEEISRDQEMVTDEWAPAPPPEPPTPPG